MAEKLYRDLRMGLNRIKRADLMLEQRQYDGFMQTWPDVILALQRCNQRVMEHRDYFNQEQELVDEAAINALFAGLLGALENRDYNLLHDLIRTRLIPTLEDWQWVWVNGHWEELRAWAEQENAKALAMYYPDLKKKLDAHQVDESQYQVEPNDFEIAMIKVCRGTEEFYLGSQSEPQNWEWRHMDVWKDMQSRKMIVFGFGAGFHINAIFERVPEAMCVEVYEPNLSILKLVFHNIMRAGMLKKSRLHLYFDPDCRQFLQALEENEKLPEWEKAGVYFSESSIRAMEDERFCKLVQQFADRVNTVHRYAPVMRENFFFNEIYKQGDVDELKGEFAGRRVYIVAAGPSLDKDVHGLKEREHDCVVLSTGTAFKKLDKLGIRPDYVILSDPNPSICHQVEGLERSDVPMLYLATASRMALQHYHGKKYCVYQKGYDYSERRAAQLGVNLYQTGGSVSTTAMDVAIGLGALDVVFLGLDLAYPEGLAHAEGISRRDAFQGECRYEVPAADGGKVMTGQAFYDCIKWLEERLDGERTPVYNVAQCGAYIKGMRYCRLEDIMKRG